MQLFNKFLYDEYKHCDKFDVFITNKITGSKSVIKNKSVINFTFQRPSTELVMASEK